MSSPIIHNDTDYAVAPMPDKVHFPRASASVIVKGTFKLVHDGVAEPLEGASQFRGDEFLDDDIYAALLYPADLSSFKSRTDVIVLGTFFAPENKPVTASYVRVIVGPTFAKQLAVLGEREVRSGLFGSKVGEPKPFTELKLGWDESYGGPDMLDNPAGKGNGNDLAPRIEWSHRLIRRLGERMEPAGLGPVNRLWPLRKRKMGTTKRKWLEERAPYHPEDFDWSYHNAAPADQQLDQPLTGDEVIECVNLHPQHATFKSRLPGKRVRAFMHHTNGGGASVKEEVELKLDTCILDMDAQTVSLVWRGVVDVEEESLQSVREILVVEEELAEEAQPAEPYLARFADASGEEPDGADDAVATDDDAANGPSGGAVAAAVGGQAVAVAGAVAQTDLVGEEAQDAVAAGAAVAGAGLSGAALASLFADWNSTMGAETSPEMQEALQDAEKLFEQSQQELDKALDTLDKVTDGDFEVPSLDDVPVDMDVLGEAEAALEKLQEYAEQYDIELPPEALEAFKDLKADPELAELAQRAAADGTPLGLSLAASATAAADEAAAAAAAEVPAEPPNEAQVRAMLDAPAPPKGPDGKAAGLGGLAAMSLAGAVLVGAKFPKGRFAGAKLQGGTMSEANLTEADFRGADVTHCDFTKADLTGADFTGAKLDGAQFIEAKLDGAIFDECHGHAVLFVAAHAKEKPPSFKKAALLEAEFQEAQLPGANFQGATLTEASFTDAKLPGATFAEADITAVRAAGADLTEASFADAKGPHAVFVGATLDKADFEGALLERASCNEASLFEARLFGGKFPNATFTGANLQHANAMNANLMFAALNKADLRYTNFAASNCYGADFNKALIAETDFSETNLQKTVLTNKALTP